jgi:hypothetical protein
VVSEALSQLRSNNVVVIADSIPFGALRDCL